MKCGSGIVGVVLLSLVVVLSGQVLELTRRMEKLCVNGEYDNETMSCRCYSGWSGLNCSQCRGRLKLSSDSGVIADDTNGMDYSGSTICLFYVEANESVSSIHLNINLLHLECQWDYLHVFDGDSVFSPKIASYTGNIVEAPSFNRSYSNDGSADGSSDGSDTGDGDVGMVIPTLNPQYTLSSSGPKILLYFYSDVAVESPGFELSYWVDYRCPNECSERGVCNATTGTCLCDLGWHGEHCEIPICPNNCSGNGICDVKFDGCVCNQGFKDEDCSVEEMAAHWSVVDYHTSLPSVTLSRASHSAVVWEDSMIVYGGYEFPSQGYSHSFVRKTNKSDPLPLGNVEGDVIRYLFGSRVWEVVNTSAAEYRELVVEDEGSGSGRNGNDTVVTLIPYLPAPRYGHSAVVVNDSMFVFGGTLYPSEVFSSELWMLNFTTSEWTPLFTKPVNSTESEDYSLPPVAVRGHTAHVIGSKMVVLFGLSPGEHTFLSYVQEYDFSCGEWVVPRQCGVDVAGRMGHSSSYSEEDGLIYVYGGRRRGVFIDQLLTYNPVSYVWTRLTPSGSSQYLHSTFLVGPLLLSYGGCQGHGEEIDCFSSDLLAYNPLCDTWEKVKLPGLPPNASRYGHSSLIDPNDGSVLIFGGFIGTLRDDMLRLVMGNCSRWSDEMECVNKSSLCAWSEGECMSVGKTRRTATVTYACSLNLCFQYQNSSLCSLANGCIWNLTSSRCQLAPVAIESDNSSSCPAMDGCGDHDSCYQCRLHSCFWGRYMEESEERCLNSSHNITEVSCPVTSCFSHTTCRTCISNNCLWCPSLSLCVTEYPVTFNFGQCLGWENVPSSCQELDCKSRKNCSSCQQLPQCGWCNAPEDTGLGECALGGYIGPQDDTFCHAVDSTGNQEEWQFNQCSACQCNGHSRCVNGSVCELCMNATTGDNCQSCSIGFFGDAHNGGSCAVCDCNGYDLECDVVSGSCQCQSLGVSGENCTVCVGDYNHGDADNFCYARLDTGFIYTFGVTADNEVQGFYAVTPPRDESLHFKFEMRENINGVPVFLQIFLGRMSEDLWVLVNITNRLIISPRGSFEMNYDDFTISVNESDPPLSSFAHPSIRDSFNFSSIFDEADENSYTKNMWDGDVTLVVHVSNLKNPSMFRITVDQQNYLFLLYFFATFVICFSVLLSVFLLAWYIKKKLSFRRMMRQQYIELQRRVARPFARITLAVETSNSLPTECKPSYVAVEACRNEKAAVLSLLVQLPRDRRTGRTTHGRTGLCVGSTLVYINSSKKPKQRERDEEKRTGQRVEGENSFLVHTGRARQRNRSDSQSPVNI